MNQQQQEDAEIFEIPTSKQNTEQTKRNSEQIDRSLSSTIFAIIYNFGWGLLFLLFRHFNDQSCQIIDSWSLYTEILLFLIAGYKLIIELPIQYQTNGFWKIKLFDTVDYVELFFNIIVLIGLTYAYLQHEECFNLRMLILGYLIITYFIVLMWGLTMIILFCKKDEISRSS